MTQRSASTDANRQISIACAAGNADGIQWGRRRRIQAMVLQNAPFILLRRRIKDNMNIALTIAGRVVPVPRGYR